MMRSTRLYKRTLDLPYSCLHWLHGKFSSRDFYNTKSTECALLNTKPPERKAGAMLFGIMCLPHFLHVRASPVTPITPYMGFQTLQKVREWTAPTMPENTHHQSTRLCPIPRGEIRCGRKAVPREAVIHPHQLLALDNNLPTLPAAASSLTSHWSSHIGYWDAF